MSLSTRAKQDLRKTLVNEIGQKATDGMTDKDLEHIGNFLLTVLACGLKQRVREKQNDSIRRI